MTQPQSGSGEPRQDGIAQPDLASAIPAPAQESTYRADWFKRMPNGGTVYLHPPMPVEWFRRAPVGGGATDTRPEPDDEDPFAMRLRVHPDTDTTGETR